MINTTGYNKAIELLRQASTPNGFVASVQQEANYKRVWTRDGVINGLAALQTGDAFLIRTFYQTIRTAFDNQHASGFIPSNVSQEENMRSYGGAVGRADNVCWAVIGLCSYINYINSDAGHELSELHELHELEGDITDNYKKKVEKCFALMEAWEFNGKHLMYVPQSGDWADEYFYHGYVLFDQLLRVWALELAAQLYEKTEWKNKAATIRQTIQTNFWNHKRKENLYSVNLQRQLQDAPANHWIMGFNPARTYHQFDLQANTLALALRIGNKQQQQTVIETLKTFINQFNHLLPSFHPAARQNDYEMEELKNNYAYAFRNEPHHFHNGGLWPVWNGLLAAALAQHDEMAAAKLVTMFIHKSNEAAVEENNKWDFNECLHGKTLRPTGTAFCTWSAGGAVMAEQALRGKNIFK